MTGSEGLLGVVTEVTVRILQKPETARALLIGFPSSESAGRCVADVISAGIIAAGMEMMDRPAIHAAEDYVHAGYPRDVEALLIVELDGPQGEVDDLLARVEKIAGDNNASTIRISQSEAERQLFARLSVFAGAGRSTLWSGCAPTSMAHPTTSSPASASSSSPASCAPTSRMERRHATRCTR